MKPELDPPPVQVRRETEMPIISRKLKMVCLLMVFNILACVFLGLTWSTEQKLTPKIRIPNTQFWLKLTANKTFWNREQQRLDVFHNPNFKANLSNLTGLPDWLKVTAPKSDPCEPDVRVRHELGDFNTLPPLFQDFLLYSHCKSFPMLKNEPGLCEDPPFLLMVVKTLIPHFERRQAIRESWGKVRQIGNKKVVTVFLVGNASATDNHPDLSELLQREAAIHKDVLQWDFRDTFLNLTLKDTLFLDWFKSFCSEAQFILKGDDDVFVNTPRIIQYLESLHPDKASDLFIGDVIVKAGPHRDKKLKYFIPDSYFEGPYPPYAGGGGVLYSGRVALKLRDVSKKVIVYPIDDVYSGMCLKKVGLTPQKHEGFRTFDIADKDKHNPCIYRSLILVHSRMPQEVKRIWNWIMLPLDCP